MSCARPDEDRWSVAVIGDGAFPSGIVFEALNNAGRFGRRLLVILNDNKMSICPRVGGVADYLDRLRMNRMYSGLKEEVVKRARQGAAAGRSGRAVPGATQRSGQGRPARRHDVRRPGLPLLRPDRRPQHRPAAQVSADGQATPKGRCCCTWSRKRATAFKPAAEDPVLFHAPPQFERSADEVVQMKKSSARAFTHAASQAIFEQMTANPRVTVITAAMCQGNKLERVRDAFPDRFFDTGICEGHAVAFAAGQAKVGLRPIVDIYSTFLQRSYDQIFQEVALQNLPVTFMLDRGGLAGPDGPTHHGVFDLGYLRVLPEHGRHGPGRRGRPAADARPRAAARRPVCDSLSEGHRARRSTASARPSNSARAKSSRGATTA